MISFTKGTTFCGNVQACRERRGHLDKKNTHFFVKVKSAKLCHKTICRCKFQI